MTAVNPMMTLLPCLPLVQPTEEDTKESKDELVVYQLKVKSTDRASTTAEKYKINVRRFSDGTPQELITLLIKLNEIWTQNSVTGANDRLATIRTILRGEALSLFEEALEGARLNEDGTHAVMTSDHVEEGLDGVKQGVFPHRALEIQKLWMRRKMRKPVDLSFRKLMAAVTRINNYIPFFPGSTENNKFSKAEIIELLKWSIPQKWHNKFDLEGYIPLLDTRATLLAKCKALECQEPVADKPKVHRTDKSSKASKF
jgi:hypothetical protein